MSYQRRSVDLLPSEFEAVLDLLAQRTANSSSDKDRSFHEQLSRKIANTPCWDNPIVMGSKELLQITSWAKSKFVDLPSNLYLSNRKLAHEEITKLALASSVIMWLNEQSNLRRLVDFDFTDISSQFEAYDE